MSTTDALSEAIEFTLGKEGGWYPGNEARDPNPTMRGVTQAAYDRFRNLRGLPRQSVRFISDTEVLSIYRGYWDPAGCNLVGRLSAIAFFDHSINAGPIAAAKILQKAIGVLPDGKLGPASRAAAALFQRRDVELATRIAFERIRHYVDIAKNPTLRPNLLSWVHRVVLYREKYLA